MILISGMGMQGTSSLSVKGVKGRDNELSMMMREERDHLNCTILVSQGFSPISTTRTSQWLTLLLILNLMESLQVYKL